MLSVNVQHTERNALLYRAYTNIQWCRSVQIGAEVSVGHFGNLVPNCPGAEVSWCRSVPRVPVTGYFLGFLNVFIVVNAFHGPCAFYAQGFPLPLISVSCARVPVH